MTELDKDRYHVVSTSDETWFECSECYSTLVSISDYSLSELLHEASKHEQERHSPL